MKTDCVITSDEELVEQMSRKVNELHRDGFGQTTICRELLSLCQEHFRKVTNNVLDDLIMANDVYPESMYEDCILDAKKTINKALGGSKQ
mgnify:CR=1 FL=1